MTNYIALFLCICASAVRLFAAQPSTQPVPDVTTPIGAAKHFMGAVTSGDTTAVRQSIDAHTPLEKQASDVWVDSLMAQKRFQRAVFQNFGKDGFREYFPNSPFPGEDAIPPDVFKDSKVTIDGNIARFKDARAGQETRLIKVDGVWKVPLEDLLTTGKLPEEKRASFVQNYIESNRDYGPAFDRTTEEIQAGKYKTLAEVREAVDRNLMDPAGGMAPTDSAAVTRPATSRVSGQ
jgi:hypothetical protein